MTIALLKKSYPASGVENCVAKGNKTIREYFTSNKISITRNLSKNLKRKVSRFYCMALLYTLLIGVATQSGFAQPIAEWDRDFGGNNWEELNSIQQTSDDGYIMAGYSSSSNNGDVSSPTQGLGDFWLVRTDPDGNLLWDNRYGGNGEERPYSVQETNDGGFIVGGWSFSGASGDKTEPSRGYFDYWVVKTDDQGTLLWEKTYGGDSTEFLYDLIQTSDGGYLLGGISMSGISGEKTGARRGNFDFWIVKTDALGNVQWDATYGGSDEERLNSLLEDDDGNFVLAGGSRSDIGGDVTTSLLGVKDFWMLKVNQFNGNIIWERRYGGIDEDEISSVNRTMDGGYLMGGGSRSNQLAGMKSQNSRGIVDMWVVKTDQAGNIEWDQTFGGTDLDNCYSAKQNSIGHYLIGGFSGSPAGGDKTEPSLGGYDFWLIYLDPDGNKLWDKTLGGSDNDVLENLFQTSDGGYLLGGHSASGPGGDKTSLNKGLNDFWIIKTRCNLSVDFRDTVICPNEALELNAFDPSCTDCAWTWNDGNRDSIRTVFPANDMTFSVTLTDGVGCARSDEINIIVNQPPDIELGNDYSICEGTTTTLDAGVANLKYLWSTNDTIRQINVDTNGVYRLLVSDTNGCTDEDSIRISIAPNPVVSLGRDSTICPGEDLILDAGNPGASYRWNPNNNTQTYRATDAGTYAVTVTDGNNCTGSDTIELSIYNKPSVSNVQAICNTDNTFYTLSFDIQNGDTATYTVSGIGGQITNQTFTSTPIPKDQAYVISIGDSRACNPELLTGSYDCECTSDAGQLRSTPIVICGDEEAVIEFSNNPTLDANDVINYLLHDGSSSQIGTVIFTSDQPTFSYRPGLVYGQTYFITVQVGNRGQTISIDPNDGCIAESNGVAISFFENPEATILPQGALLLTCDDPTLILDGSSSMPMGDLNYSWGTFQEGNIMGNPNASQIEVNQNGNYILSVTHNSSTCLDRDTIIVNAENDLPIASIQTPETYTCTDTLIQLDASSSSSGPDIEYLWQGGNITGSTIQNPIVNQPGNYSLRVRNSQTGCTANTTVIVPENRIFPQVNAGTADFLDCLMSSIELSGTYSSNGNVSVAWLTQDGNILAGEQSLRPTVDMPGIYTLQVTDLENGCIGENAVEVFIDPDVPTSLVLNVQDINCHGEADGNIEINAVIGGSPPYLYSFDGGPFTGQINYANLSMGQYPIIVEDINGCQWDTIVSITEPSPFVLSLGQGMEIQLGETVDLRPQYNMPLTSFRWISADTAFCTNCLSPTIAPTNTTIYRLEVTNEEGCTIGTSITIAVRKKRDVFIPTVFTPNLDGINERFVIYGGKSVDRIKVFRIFDRWGELVYQLTNEAPNQELLGWNGRFKGEPMPAGVYIYYAEIEFTDGWIELYKGDLTLLR